MTTAREHFTNVSTTAFNWGALTNDNSKGTLYKCQHNSI
jgi:hypothetical protein